MENFHPLEVVGRDSETQLQVDENLNKRGLRESLSLPSALCLFY